MIICGDFNVCVTKKDVYIPSNVTEEKAESLETSNFGCFKKQLRVNFNHMLKELKFVDCFREKYKDEVKYSAWP